jgi:hypothetical protein
VIAVIVIDLGFAAGFHTTPAQAGKVASAANVRS